MNTVELIRKKREGYQLSEEEIDFLIGNYSNGKIPDYPICSFLNGSIFKGNE